MCRENRTPEITVFTPAYNRGNLIERLYRSLQNQSFHSFEWLVVDDGSTDDTEERFQKILAEENPFEIRYIKTENGGKHRAINRGVQEAAGRMFVIVDSDDYLAEEALQTILDREGEIPADQRSRFAGICGTKCYAGGRTIGHAPSEILDITTLQRREYGLDGDKSEVFYLDILKEYPFPEYEGERFLTEAVVWDRIAADGYVLRFFPEALIVCEYREDGLSARAAELNHSNPQGYGLYLSQSAALGKIRGKEKYREFLDFFYGVREKWSFLKIAEVLHENPMKLWIIFLGFRIYNKLFDRSNRGEA